VTLTLQPKTIVHAADSHRLPEEVERWMGVVGSSIERLTDPDAVVEICLRSRPRVVLLDGRGPRANPAKDVLKRIKADAFTSVIPCVMIIDADDAGVQASFSAGADEVLSTGQSGIEILARLDAAVRRSDRDVRVHPSTRLPGAVEIDAEIARRMTLGEAFAACYADLDYFKEFNDRYSYYQGDRVIRIVSQILHDVVKGLCRRSGFVGHIGGDDFIFIIPIQPVSEVCAEIITVFDALIPLQYSEQDRRAGYFFGKDRRGQLHRVPLMTISIGVVTTERRRFTHAAQVSALATEMKSYAKTLLGSVFAIDRRQDEPADESARGSGPIRLIAPPKREGGKP
jgi:diguanylate cyclase (GGDEF)-like protein